MAHQTGFKAGAQQSERLEEKVQRLEEEAQPHGRSVCCWFLVELNPKNHEKSFLGPKKQLQVIASFKLWVGRTEDVLLVVPGSDIATSRS